MRYGRVDRRLLIERQLLAFRVTSHNASKAGHDMTKQTVTIDNLAFGGDGAARLEDGRVVFVPRTIPGETVEIEITKSKKSWARARIVGVIEPSEERVEPGCPHFHRCGGCQFWHMDYDAELRHKTAAARESIERLSHSTIPEPELVGAPDYRRYRNRATFHIQKGKVGFYSPGTNKVVDLDTCPVVDERIERARKLFSPIVKKVDGGDLFIETAGPDEVVVVLDSDASAEEVRGTTQELAKIAERNPLIRGAIVDGKHKEDRMVVGEPTPDASEAVQGGPGHFVVPARRFRQGHQAMNFRMVKIVSDLVEEIAPENVLELFAGMGNLTAGIARNASHVDAFEYDHDSVKTGRSILNAMGHMNVRLKRADHTEVPLPAGEVESHQLVVLDPPRTGAREVCEALGNHPATDVVYVACDAACLGRDAKTLLGHGFEWVSVTMLDMFPRTAHVETIAHFRRG